MAAGWKTAGCRLKQKRKKFSSQIRQLQRKKHSPTFAPIQMKYIHNQLFFVHFFSVPVDNLLIIMGIGCVNLGDNASI